MSAEPRCPECGTPIRPDWDWCQACGYDPEGLRPPGAGSTAPVEPGPAGPTATTAPPGDLLPPLPGVRQPGQRPPQDESPSRGTARKVLTALGLVVGIGLGILASRLLFGGVEDAELDARREELRRQAAQVEQEQAWQTTFDASGWFEHKPVDDSWTVQLPATPKGDFERFPIEGTDLNRDVEVLVAALDGSPVDLNGLEPAVWLLAVDQPVGELVDPYGELRSVVDIWLERVGHEPGAITFEPTTFSGDGSPALAFGGDSSFGYLRGLGIAHPHRDYVLIANDATPEEWDYFVDSFEAIP